jgi:hypothetical protein
MFYIIMIAEALNIDIETAKVVFSNTFVAEGFSNASSETIISQAKWAYNNAV